MAVSARGKSWQASVSFGGKRYRRDFPTKAEAMTWEAHSKAAAMRGEEPQMVRGSGSLIGAPSMGVLMEITQRRVWAGKGGEATAMVNARLLVRELGASTHPVAVTTSVIDDMVARWKREGKAGGTINRRLAALSKMLKTAKREGMISVLPEIDRQKESEGRLRFISEAEETMILRYFQQVCPPMAEFTTVALDTGFRLGELLGLRPGHIDGEWLYLSGEETKSGRERRVPMTARVKEILVRRAEGKGERDRLFHEIIQSRQRHQWDRMVEKLELRDVVFHTCRHTFCSRLVQRGANLVTVQRLAGHSTMQMTMRYAKLVDRNLTDAVALLEPARAHATPV